MKVFVAVVVRAAVRKNRIVCLTVMVIAVLVMSLLTVTVTRSDG